MNCKFCCRHFFSVSVGCVFLLQNSSSMPPVPTQNVSSEVNTLVSEDKIGIQGNWVKKKDWLLKLNEVNAQIQDLSVAISGYKKVFNTKFYTADGMLETFYKDIGQRQGKISEIFDSALRYLENKKKKDIAQLTLDSSASEQGQNRERVIKIEIVEQKINSLKNDLEQLKLDMKSIEELGTSMQARMKKVEEAIKTAKDEATAAQTSTDEAWQIIDDKKVKLKYYELQGSSQERLKSIEGYLRDDLSRDFDSVVDTLRMQIEKIQTSIKQLEDKGLFIKNRAHRIEEIKIKQLRDFKDKQKSDEEKLRKEAALKRKEVAKPWYQRWYNTFVRYVASTVTFFNQLIGKQSHEKSSPPSIAQNSAEQSPVMQSPLSLQIPLPSTLQPGQFPILPSPAPSPSMPLGQ